MERSCRNNRILYRLIVWLISPFLRLIFRFQPEIRKLEGPSLLVCNHVTNFDPLLVATCFPKDHIHVVASEHLFRLGFLSKIIQFIADPIPRRKATTGADTAMACLRKLRQGNHVGIFVEGECSWDGVTADIIPSTGRMAKMSKATLVTCRLEGGYLTAPRWGKGIRPGKMSCRIVGVYSPEELKSMDPDRIEELVQRDLHTDIWLQQRMAPVRYRSRRPAENLQTVLYLCPACRRVGQFHSRGKFLSCGCGARWEFTEFGNFVPAEPFENIAQWDAWQKAELAQMQTSGELVLRDAKITPYRLETGHQQTKLPQADLKLEGGVLRCGELQWELSKIDDLALVQSRNLLLSAGSDYYQLKAAKSCSLRKYRAAWEAARANQVCEV